jgi:NitT/TauT family transport system substrate-binding protein
VEDLRITATGHGLNYLPEYLATATGGFARRNLTVTAQARDPWTGVLSDLADGTADVALGGLWVPAMYAGKTRGLVAVGQLNARFPMVVLTRQAEPDFSWVWMKGRTVLAPGAGGSAPYEFTAGLMRETGATPSDSRFVRDLSTDMLVELFDHGLGDALIVDLLTGTRLEQAGVGHIACRLAEVGGPMPNSVYYVRRDRLDGLFDRLVSLLGGILAAMAELTSGTAATDELTASHWPDVPPAALRAATAELSANGTWAGIRIEPAASDRWVSILRDAGLVDGPVSYDKLVDARVMDAVAALDVG